MGTGLRATFVISWSQTEVDGFQALSPDALTVGAAWRWTGAAVRIDAPGDVLLLEGAEGGADIRRRAARMVQRLIGVAVGSAEDARPEMAPLAAEEPPEQSFVVTDGLKSHIVTILPVPDSGARLLMFMGEVPPEGRDLWIVRTQIDRSGGAAGSRASGGVICFAPGTRILTPSGLCAVESLREGDLVQTRDNGPQQILWTGSRRMTGARLYAMPHLRPIRFREGAFGTGRPDADLLVSPQHRLLVRGATARALFNTDEVLVAAEDLVNDTTVLVDKMLREVTYHHLLLDRHDIVFANGVETESFHPSATALETVDVKDRARLLAILPGIEVNPMSYGDFARRSLSASEAAILRHEAGPRAA
ncbi:Hint domain-containing protein [Xinfangfangia pollutisoli]|uniref:Hint domain-containing protein n=1 Tax=Xinfangfangia pollutisoli TaxID=2865960 RepID=UPI001CD79E0A|nr:Hint domain-containing protein [Xinfangfangia pollutisoli]